MDIEYKGDLKKLAGSQNICNLLEKRDIETIGLHSLDGYQSDKTSRIHWEEWNAEAMKLALQVKGVKSFPWPNCSNIRFPLMTIAALNFHAKAYPAIVGGDSVVKCRSLGKDPDGQKYQRAIRVGNHMSYQLLECSPWEEQTDKGLLTVAIMGCGFKKTIRDNNQKKNCSDFVMAQDLVLNYYTTDLETAPRASHRFTLTRNELRENIIAGFYREPDSSLPSVQPLDPLQVAKDEAQKVTAPDPSKDVHFLIEQSRFLDLDGDGYEEPYAVTFDEATGFVYRIIARYYPSDIEYAKGKDGKPTKTVLRISPENYYTKIPFIPSPDGGFYDIGLGVLLGPITESVSTLINQITDWATMSITAGGFLGRGVRMKAGETTFKPLEWKTVESTGDDLNKNIVPLPVKELSPVLLDLLKFLVNYGERIAGSGDIQVGELPGQNVKTGTMQIANENGRLIFNAIFKRIWRSLKDEFKKLYRLNRYYQEDDEFAFGKRISRSRRRTTSIPTRGSSPRPTRTSSPRPIAGSRRTCFRRRPLNRQASIRTRS
jgi:chaperonin GroES